MSLIFSKVDSGRQLVISEFSTLSSCPVGPNNSAEGCTTDLHFQDSFETYLILHHGVLGLR